MNKKKLGFLLAGTAAFGALAFAHHIDKPLSSVFGHSIIDTVSFYTATGKFGVPSYRHSSGEFGHHQVVPLAPGDSFDVADGLGNLETITFEATDFPDIAQAEIEQILAVVSAKSALIDGALRNGYAVLNGEAGGAAARIDLVDGAGSPLQQLQIAPGTGFGSDHIDLEISIPHDHPVDLAGHNYWLVASTTAGSTPFLDQTLPIGVDPYANLFLWTAALGGLPGWIGQLDANNDASVRLQGNLVDLLFQGNYPEKLYFAYFVMSPDWSTLELVSNRFTVEFK